MWDLLIVCTILANQVAAAYLVIKYVWIELENNPKWYFMVINAPGVSISGSFSEWFRGYHLETIDQSGGSYLNKYVQIDTPPKKKKKNWKTIYHTNEFGV